MTTRGSAGRPSARIGRTISGTICRLSASRSIPDLLDDALKDQGLSQRAFARELGIRQQTVSKWVRGAAVPRVLMLRRIAEVLGLDARELGTAIIGERTPPSGLERIFDRLSSLDQDQLAEVEQFVLTFETLSSSDDGDPASSPALAAVGLALGAVPAQGAVEASH